MSGQGSGGNVLAAICSLLIPGLGQLVQGRLGKAIWHFLLGIIVWVVTLTLLGWVVHIWSAYEAARYEPRSITID